MRRQLLRWKQPQLHTACSLTLPWRHCHVSSEPATTTVDIATIQQSLSSPSPGVAAAASKTMKIRGRVENSRVRGKIAFIHLRQPPFHSIQVVAAGAELAGRVKDITPESIIDVGGTLVPAERPVTSVTCSHYELHAETINVVSKSATPLPFPIKDHNTKLDTRLNHRVIDMRTPLTASVLRLVSAVCQCFRSELLARDFVEIHTPKLLGTASEGGSAVFTVDYFGKPGYLAQSPQLYKQMAVMGDALGVFEIGPLFRAENSLTHRHLTEFVGLDAEFVVQDAYTEILDVLESTVCGMIYHLQENHAEMIQQVRGFLTEVEKSNTAGSECLEEENKEGQEGKENGNIVCELSQETLDKFGFLANKEREEGARTWATTVEGLLSTDSYHGRVCAGTMNEINNNNNEGMNKKRPQPKVLRLSFENAVRLLLHHSVIDEPISDFTLPQERRLGELVRARYGVDVYIVDQFPASSRPFYTLPHPSRAELTCSFDMYLRGEEICSGAQRIHDAALLLQNIGRLQADAAHLKDYVDAFRYGAWPHGGFGLGLERIVLFLLGAKDIRQISLFPRDPKRLTP